MSGTRIIPKPSSAGGKIIVSNPPSEKSKILNIYVDSSTGKVVVEYENTPVS